MTDEDILKIYRSRLSLTTLAKQYGCSRSTIGNIKSAKTHASITQPEQRWELARARYNIAREGGHAAMENLEAQTKALQHLAIQLGKMDELPEELRLIDG